MGLQQTLQIMPSSRVPLGVLDKRPIQRRLHGMYVLVAPAKPAGSGEAYVEVQRDAMIDVCWME